MAINNHERVDKFVGWVERSETQQNSCVCELLHRNVGLRLINVMKTRGCFLGAYGENEHAFPAEPLTQPTEISCVHDG
ncbi:MAG: hypothetical protein K9N21_10005, partial [Deltaproteobacteria bacterium]|nr:hypothetical protein [Deltaproteobacteria bacterium]